MFCLPSPLAPALLCEVASTCLPAGSCNPNPIAAGIWELFASLSYKFLLTPREAEDDVPALFLLLLCQRFLLVFPTFVAAGCPGARKNMPLPSFFLFSVVLRLSVPVTPSDVSSYVRDSDEGVDYTRHNKQVSPSCAMHQLSMSQTGTCF